MVHRLLATCSQGNFHREQWTHCTCTGHLILMGCEGIRACSTKDLPGPTLMPGCVAAASRVCQLTGKKANNGYVVTFSHKRNKKLQGVNLQYKRLYWPEAQRFVRLRLSHQGALLLLFI